MGKLLFAIAFWGGIIAFFYFLIMDVWRTTPSAIMFMLGGFLIGATWGIVVHLIKRHDYKVEREKQQKFLYGNRSEK